MKIARTVGAVIVTICFFPFVLFVFPKIILSMGAAIFPNPPLPEIRYGEFPFKLVYTINGEVKVIEDTVICEFDGIGTDLSTGKHRKWKSRLASGNEEVILLRIDATKYIYYLPGSSRYYMGDLEKYATWEHRFPNANIYDANSIPQRINADELLSEYGIKLISWEPSPPIVNSFR